MNAPTNPQQEETSDGRHQDTDGAPPRQIHIETKKVNWLAWLLLALGLLALLLALIRRHHRDADAAPVTTAAPAEVVAAMPTAGDSTVLATTSGLGGYLAGTDAPPRTFTFEKLNFDTDKE